MKLFERWRSRRKNAPKEPEAAEATEPTLRDPPPRAPGSRTRGRRPSTMGKTVAEAAYLAEAAMRAKNNDPS